MIKRFLKILGWIMVIAPVVLSFCDINYYSPGGRLLPKMFAIGFVLLILIRIFSHKSKPDKKEDEGEIPTVVITITDLSVKDSSAYDKTKPLLVRGSGDEDNDDSYPASGIDNISVAYGNSIGGELAGCSSDDEDRTYQVVRESAVYLLRISSDCEKDNKDVRIKSLPDHQA